jgi:uncharacterized membrane protein
MAEIIVLRIIHVVGGLFWVGTALFNSFFLFPAMSEAGPAAGTIIGSMRRRHLFTVLPLVALITILAGIRLMWITSADFSAEYFQSGRGSTFAWSGTAAIAAFIIGITLGRPTGMKMGAVQQSLGNAQDDTERARLAAELQRLQRRNRILSIVVNTLLVLTAAGMAAARYVV